jgi:hypothetical protein
MMQPTLTILTKPISVVHADLSMYPVAEVARVQVCYSDSRSF